MEKELKILKFAMSMELDGHSFYDNYAKNVQNPTTKQLFEGLSKMETAHYEYLKSQYDNLSNGKPIEKPDRNLGNPEIFNKNAAKEGNPSFETKASDITLLRMAYLIEEDFMKFYKKAADNVDDEAVKNLLTNLSEWEKGHREMLGKQFESSWEKMGFNFSTWTF